MTGRLTLITTARTGIAGLLTWSAWEALRAADAVYLASGASAGGDDPKSLWPVALADADVQAHPLDLDGLGMAGLARELLSQARAGRSVAWLGSADGDVGLALALTSELMPEAAAAEAASQPEIEVLAGSWDQPGSAVLELVSVMDQLRSPGGCPWDAEQTHASLVPYVLEEAYEVAEAIEQGSRDDVVEELGDLLLQVVFHARVGEEAQDDDAFDLDEIADGITAKLRRRHPHVFADVHAPTAEHVAENWEQIKQAEKGRESAFDGVPVALPALSRAAKVLGRFDRAGVSVPDLTSVADGSLEGALAARVLAVVAAAQRDGVDLEAAVRAAVHRLVDRGRGLEKDARRV